MRRSSPLNKIMKIQNIIKNNGRDIPYGWCTFKTIFGTIYGYYIPEHEIILSFSERDLKEELKKRKLI